MSATSCRRRVKAFSTLPTFASFQPLDDPIFASAQTIDLLLEIHIAIFLHLQLFGQADDANAGGFQLLKLVVDVVIGGC